MKGTIALGWLLATVLFALLGNAGLTIAFFIFAVIFSFFTISNDYKTIKNYAVNSILKDLETGADAPGEIDE